MIARIIMVLLLSVITASTFFTADADAASDGLSVTPARQELSTIPGKAGEGDIIIGNLSNQDIQVSLDAKTFSVADFTYDYEFDAGKNKDWVRFAESMVSLKAGESKKIRYIITPPAAATPGGYYFSLFASTTIQGAGAPSTVQAVSLVYVTVGGELVRTSVMQNVSVPFFVTGSEVPYSFDVKNTGNVHFSAYFYGQIESLFWGKQPEFGNSHLLMPQATRSIKSAIPAPLLPGIYKVEYGYKVDFADIVTTQTGFIVYVPPWSVIALIFVVLLSKWVWQRRT